MYLADIVMFLRTLEEQIDHIWHLLTPLYDGEVKLQLKKCEFFTYENYYLEHFVRPRRLKIASHTTIAVRGLEPPTAFTELRTLLGLCHIVHRLVYRSTRLAASQNKSSRKYQPATFWPRSEEECSVLNAL